MIRRDAATIMRTIYVANPQHIERKTSIVYLQSVLVLGRMRFNLAFVVFSARQVLVAQKLQRDKVKNLQVIYFLNRFRF